MNKRPRSILVVSWLFILTALISIAHGVLPLGHELEGNATPELVAHERFDMAMVCLVSSFALVGGILTLTGINGGRYLLAAWMAFHIVLSAIHSAQQLLIHSLLFGVISYYLFSRRSAAFFTKSECQKPPT